MTVTEFRDHDPEKPTCINDGDPEGCDGPVEYRMPLTDTNQSYARCDKHWTARLILQAENRLKYPTQQPADFDPSYAGERWNEDD